MKVRNFQRFSLKMLRCVKTSEKANVLITRLQQHYCSDLVSTAEASKGVLNGERRVTRYT